MSKLSLVIEDHGLLGKVSRKSRKRFPGNKCIVILGAESNLPTLYEHDQNREEMFPVYRIFVLPRTDSIGHAALLIRGISSLCEKTETTENVLVFSFDKPLHFVKKLIK